MSKNSQDIAALESMEVAYNYNKYVFNKILSEISGNQILDYGAGFGLFCKFLQEENKNIYALEINEEALKVLKERNIASFNKFNHIDIKFSEITSLNVLEHVDDDSKILNQISNLLQIDGKIILYLPASMLVWTELDEIVNHKRRYTKKSIESLALETNLHIEKIYYVDFIGWITLLISKALRLKINFSPKKIEIYDKLIFKHFSFLDKIFSKIIGKNILIVLSKK
tara:strand:- start:3221 stop:3898 length:678 start_codon:yes stop_codon:yes gene_type:complete